MKLTAMQQCALDHPCFLAEETAHPQFSLLTRHGSLVLTINSGFE